MVFFYCFDTRSIYFYIAHFQSTLLFIFLIRSSGPGGLDQRENFCLFGGSDSYISSSCLCNHRRIRFMNHHLAGGSILHLHTNLILGIIPGSLIYCICRTLGSQNQMYAQRTSFCSYGVNHFFDNRSFLDQLFKFIKYDQKSWHRFFKLTLVISFYVLLDILCTYRSKNGFSSPQLMLQRLKTSVNPTANIRNNSTNMWKLFKRCCRTSAFIINHYKRNILRMIITCNR